MTSRLKLTIVLLISLFVFLGCSAKTDSSKTELSWPTKPPSDLRFGERRIEVLIHCYKLMELTRQRYSGIGPITDGVVAQLEPTRRIIEDRVVGDLTPGIEKMHLNVQIEGSLQQLLRDKPYGSAEIVLEGARYCAGLEARNAWRYLRP